MASMSASTLGKERPAYDFAGNVLGNIAQKQFELSSYNPVKGTHNKLFGIATDTLKGKNIPLAVEGTPANKLANQEKVADLSERDFLSGLLMGVTYRNTLGSAFQQGKAIFPATFKNGRFANAQGQAPGEGTLVSSYFPQANGDPNPHNLVTVECEDGTLVKFAFQRTYISGSLSKEESYLHAAGILTVTSGNQVAEASVFFRYGKAAICKTDKTAFSRVYAKDLGAPIVISLKSALKLDIPAGAAPTFALNSVVLDNLVMNDGTIVEFSDILENIFAENSAMEVLIASSTAVTPDSVF